MAKPPSIRLLIECLLVAVLGFGIWQLYFRADKKAPRADRGETERAPKSSRFIQDKAKPGSPVPRRFAAPPSLSREEGIRPETAAPPEEPAVPQEGFLAGMIVDEEGKKIIGPLTVSDDGQTFSLETFNGEFQETLAPGRYTVTARDADNAAVSPPVVAEITAGETQSIQLVLPTLRLGDVGIDFQKRNDWIEVTGVWRGGPAQQAGIQPGDLIIEIGGNPVRELGRDTVTELFTGPVGSQVEVIMAVAEDDGWVDVPVTLTRDALSQ